MEKAKFEFIKDALDVSEINVTRHTNKYIDVIKEWEKTDNKTLKFSLNNQSEKNSCRSSISSYLRKNNLDYVVYSERNKNNIYIVRA